ncbi:MAG: RluA family pseudouridine synthase, partial [Suilimivivens sp.]
YLKAYKELQGITVVYENHHMMLLNKPAGILSQKAKDTDFSVNEWLIGYLLEKKEIEEESLRTYRPSVCNRLDRNTSGLVICAKTLAGSQHLNQLIRERRVRKFYRLFVKGSIEREESIEGYLKKDELTNKVSISSRPSQDASYIKTRYYPVKQLFDMTYLEVELITGKPHQIRAHMASIAHPVLMDYKYGDKSFNEQYKERLKASGQLLHAYRLEFAPDDPLLEGGEHTFIAAEPSVFMKLLQEK